MSTLTMGLNASQMPEIARPDAGVALVTQWTVGAPDRQEASADAALAAWERVPWPQDLLSMNSYVGTSGADVLTYSQWTSAEAYREFLRSGGPPPDIERPDPVMYRLYRSRTSNRRPPGCIVVVEVKFDGPDEPRQRRWVDTVFEALDAEPVLHPGGIAGYFHLSIDGTRVLNYAEWTSEEAHCEAIENSGQGTVGGGTKWREVRDFPGVLSSGFTRYRFFRGRTK